MGTRIIKFFNMGLNPTIFGDRDYIDLKFSL